MTKIIEAIVRVRRGTAATAAANNIVLKEGEGGLETDTRRLKFGDGVTAWNALPYATVAYSVSLEAIGGLTPAADRLPYYTGASTAALATFTAFGRSLVDDADAAAGRSTLGLGNMATQGAGAVNITGGTIAGLTSLTATKLIQIGADQVMELENSTNNTHGLAFYGAGHAYDASIKQTPSSGELRIDVGRSLGWGGEITFCVDTLERWRVETAGNFRPGSDNAYSLGTAAGRASVVYAATGSINTSDKRLKRDIGAIPDEWLDAWGAVEWCRFKFKDGERWHVGLIAQQVRDAFAERGLDATAIGLICYDEWEARPAIREKHNRKGELIRLARAGEKAGNRWALRYDECEAMEAAWQRRELANLRAELAELKQAK